MAQRWVTFVPVIVGVCAGFGIGLIIMASAHADTRPAPTTVGNTAPTALVPTAPATTTAVANAAAPLGERQLDTSTTNNLHAPAPVTTFRVTKARSKPGSDENLPTWVPLRGRLSVVEAPDLAENLGVVPKGTTKNAQERVSVADLLDKAPAAQSASGTQPASATWLAANGRFRHGRSR